MFDGNIKSAYNHPPWGFHISTISNIQSGNYGFYHPILGHSVGNLSTPALEAPEDHCQKPNTKEMSLNGTTNITSRTSIWLQRSCFDSCYRCIEYSKSQFNGDRSCWSSLSLPVLDPRSTVLGAPQRPRFENQRNPWPQICCHSKKDTQ